VAAVGISPQLPGQPLGTPGQPAPNGVAPTPQAAPPFVLTEIEQAEVFRLLQMWENESAKVKTFNSEFERWEYDAVWGPGSELPMIKSKGILSFSKPDKGSFKIDAISRWTKNDPQNADPKSPGDWKPQPDEIGEHWVCDGKAVYEYNHRDKQLVVTSIPEEMRGVRIVDGPLPFLFGAEAKSLMNRYWIRIAQSNPEEIRLEAFPRWQSDAANYMQVDVMLNRKKMQPTAIQVHQPGGQQKHVYIFKEPKVNESNLGSWFTSLFSAPRTPLGWTRVMTDTGAAPQAATAEAPLQR
jgi:TIGR03009 family protein